MQLNALPSVLAWMWQAKALCDVLGCNVLGCNVLGCNVRCNGGTQSRIWGTTGYHDW
jgi:hypothetical protein